MQDRSHYYLHRINDGYAALNRGGPDTPLVTALRRWGKHAPILQVGEYEIPGAWESYCNGLREIIDAVDEEDRQAAFRFQLVGELWEINFTANDGAERGMFHDSRGLQHYARLLNETGQEIPSVVLDGKTSNRPAALAEIAVLDRFSRQDEIGEQEIRTLAAEVQRLDQEIKKAKGASNLERAHQLFLERERLRDSLHAEEGNMLEVNFRQKPRSLGPDTPGRKINKTVARAMSRALDVLRGRKMVALARFLERSVDSTGSGFVYRPDPPAPPWVL